MAYQDVAKFSGILKKNEKFEVCWKSEY